MTFDRRARHIPGSYPAQRANNRRAFPRWSTVFEVRFGAAKYLPVAAPLEIGEGGLSFRCDQIFPVGTEMTLEYRLTGTIAVDTGWVIVRAVVRHSSVEKIGVEFLNLRLHDRLRIVDYITAQ